MLSYADTIQDVINAIEAGAAPYLLDPSTKALLAQRYDTDFKRELPPNGTRVWSNDKNYILPLAERIGQLAAALTLTSAAATKPPSVPTYAGQVQVDIAAYIASQLYCPPSSPGRYCMSYTLDTNGAPPPQSITDAAIVLRVAILKAANP